MFDSAPNESTPSSMEAPGVTQQTSDQPPKESNLSPTEPYDLPRPSTFAEEPPLQEGTGSKKEEQGRQPVMEQQVSTVEQSKPPPEIIETPKQQVQPQPRLNELEQPLIGQTATPALPSVYKGPDAIGLQLSALGVELVAVRTALKERLARSLSGFNFPGKVGSKG